jgi:hypothetical protein
MVVPYCFGNSVKTFNPSTHLAEQGLAKPHGGWVCRSYALGKRLLSNIRQFLKIIGDQGRKRLGEDLGSKIWSCVVVPRQILPHVDTRNLSRFGSRELDSIGNEVERVQFADG